LRRQVGVLTWILGAAIALLGGVFLWLGYTLKVEQARLSQQVQSSGDRQELAQLQQQIDSLRQQIPDNLDGDLAANRDRLEALDSRIEAIATDVQTRSQTLAVLTRALQDLIEVQSPASTATSPDPDSSRDRADDAEENMTDPEADESNAEGE
jgi:cell division protein FtsB